MEKARSPKRALKSASTTAVVGLMALAIPLATAPAASALVLPNGMYIPDNQVYETYYQPVDYRSQQGGELETTNTVPAGMPADVIRGGFGPPGTTYRANPNNEVRLDVGLFTGDVYIPREARNKVGTNRLGVDITYPDGTEETSWFTVEVPETTAAQSRLLIDGYPGGSLLDERVVSQVSMRVGHEEVLEVRNINPSQGLEGFFDEGASLWMTDEYGNGEEVTEWAHLKQYGDAGQRTYEMRLTPSDSDVGWNRIPLTARYADGSWRTIFIDVIVSDDAHLTPVRSIPEVQVEAWSSLRVPMQGPSLPEGTIYRGVDSNPRWAKVNRFTGEVHYEPKSAGIQLRPYDIGVSAKLPDGSMMTINTRVTVVPYNQGQDNTDVGDIGGGGETWTPPAPDLPDEAPVPTPDYPDPPEITDSDGDGFPDEVEDHFGTNPSNPDSFPSEEELAEFLPGQGDGTVYTGDSNNPEWLEIDPATGNVGIREGYTGDLAPTPGEYPYRIVEQTPAADGEIGNPNSEGTVYEGVFTVEDDGSISADPDAGDEDVSAAGSDEGRTSFGRAISAGNNGTVRIVDPEAASYTIGAGTTRSGKVNELPEWISVDERTGAVRYDVPEGAAPRTYVVVVTAHDEAGDVLSESVVTLNTEGGDSESAEAVDYETVSEEHDLDKGGASGSSAGWLQGVMDALRGR